MPANYIPDPTATQAPAAAPDPDNFPTEALPVDGDAANAASIAQAHKVVGDDVAWLKAPRAKGSSWAQAVRKYMNARLQLGSFVDHNGLLNGRSYEWTEMWLTDAGLPFQINSGSGSLRRWTWNTNSAVAGGVSSQAPGVAAGFNHWNNTKSLVLTLDGAAGGNYGQLQADPTSCFTNDCYASMDVDFAFETVVSVDWKIGFLGNGDLVGAPAHAIYLERPDVGGTNLLVKTVAGGAPTSVNTGIAGTAAVAHHLTIQWWGSNIADDAAAHAIFILDGNVFDITATLPNAGGPFTINPLFGGITTGAVATPKMILGPIRYCQITPRT